ncbi:glycyl aminopeptidase. Metallo peptidase. MEROPS family M61 [Pseudoxanthomonas sp. GM95]|uniref:M61 family metallopeptidase n=1 Tax=Pseudoxanthomonas sp. GM95 TaxID=1881043 RepID=UPI0008CE6EBA|nr:M61 family metallopeptidase [Pseudoxanthomonas sp. GM95]SEM21517.1 glycyl aminopeptidase. Metallo peptidase. MEROPS family M61 [Pseudoxanthomonas sp. GM95]
MSFARRAAVAPVIRPRTRLAAALGLVLLASTAAAQVVRKAEVPPPQDVAYPGQIALAVDASDTTQGIFRVHESIPVQAGKVTLLYPEWIPGAHSPSGPIAQLAGLKFTAGGQPLAWKRDPYDVYAFHVDVPAGATTLEADFQYLSSRGGGFQMTDKMLMLDWDQMSLYPAGYYTHGIQVQPRVTLPAGWQFGSALRAASKDGATTVFNPVPYNTLVDSPIYAGLHFKQVDLTPKGGAPVMLDIVADDAKDLEMTPEQLAAHKALPEQATRLFGSHHYDHYDFLFSLSDQLAGNGLEHHQSSENGLDTNYFSGWKDNPTDRDLLAHEFTHSWNGKFRRGADLATPNFSEPMGDSLLWVYEGATQYWGFVLTARSGLWTPQQFRDALAMVAANYDRNRVGFNWRTLEDTTNDPTAAHRAPLPYRSWQMSEEYYSAGQMVWLQIDARLRALTSGKKSLDDFAKAFFGVDDGSYVTHPYTFEDVLAALDGVAHDDWAGFLKAHVQTVQPSLLDGLAASGWKLVYTDTPSEYEAQYNSHPQSARHRYNFAWSIGLTMNDDGTVNDVRWDGPAFKAGVSTGAKLVAVDGHEYSADALKQAITESKGTSKPVTLLLQFQGSMRTVQVDYHDGLQYPHLVRVEGTPDYLSESIKKKG